MALALVVLWVELEQAFGPLRFGMKAMIASAFQTARVGDLTKGETVFDCGKKLMVSAGLAGVLAFGMVGCTTETTVTTTTTDENGSETTTTTTTKTDENGSQTTTTTTTSSDNSPLTYHNEVLGFQATLPEAFKQITPEESVKGEETVLYAANDKNEVVGITYRDLSVEPKYEGPNPWATAYSEALQEMLEGEGETAISMTTTEGKLAGVPCTILECKSKTAAGNEILRDYFFFVAQTDKGLEGLYVTVMANSEDSLTQLENCFMSMSAE